MRFATLLGLGCSLASLFTAVVASSESPAGEAIQKEPEVIATAAFPEENTFNQVVNGQKNTLTVTVENRSGQNVTLLAIAGSLTHPDTNALLKNLTVAKYSVLLLDHLKLQIPYTFYSEFKPGDHRLNIWLEHAIGEKKYKVDTYESIVTIVEPQFSIFDFKLISTYLIVAAILGGAGYFAYLSFVPAPKKKSKKTAPAVSSPVGPVTATGTGGYQEEWIPEHHLRKPKSAKKAGGLTSGTSGDELSGVESSANEGKRRKGKKH